MRHTSTPWLLPFILLSSVYAGGVSASSAAVSPAPSTFPVPTFATATDLQRLLDQRVKDSPGVGIIVGVVDHGKTTVYKAGTSGTIRPLDEHTLFEIGSVTKTFTATMLASMVLDHSVRLDDPVRMFVPATVHVPSRNGNSITLLNLATQHSGLPRLPTNLNPVTPDPYANYTIANLYQFLNSYALTRNPGAQFEYSNLGIALLGDALANRTKVSYSQLLGSRVLTPLGMGETTTSPTQDRLSRMALGHDEDGNPVKPWRFQAFAPAGAIISSLDDMLKYLRANLGQGSLGKACLFAQQPRDAIPGGRIGLVWWIGNTTHVIHHGGDTVGYHAEIAIAPDHTKGAVVLTNDGAWRVENLAIHAVDAAFPIPTPRTVVHIDPATLGSYVGTYNISGFTFTITLSGDKLMARLTGQEAARIYPSAKDHFFYRVVDAQIDFTRDADGAVNGLVLRQSGNNTTFVRTGTTAPPSGVVESYPPVVTLDPQTLKEYVGTYASASGYRFAVTLQGDVLLVQLAGQPAVQVFPSAKDHFYYKIVDAQIDFERGTNGLIKNLVLHQGGVTISADRQ